MSNVVNLFLEIVQIDSPTGFETEMSDFVYDFSKQLGFETVKDQHKNVIIKVPGEINKESFLLNAHLDTVEPGKQIKPFIDDSGMIRSKGETILGADNKTAVAAILTLLKKIRKNKNYNGHPLEVVFTTSEESGNHGAHGLNYSYLTSKKGYCSDASNSSFGDLIIASPFYNRFDIEYIGVSAHASQSKLANNVTKSLGNFLSNVKTGIINNHTISNIGIVNMGDVVNTVPGYVKISGEVRSYKEDDLEKITKEIILLAENSITANLKFKSNVIRENGGLYLDESDSFVQSTFKIVKRYNSKSKLIKSWGCYDANVFSEHGISLINIADGSLDSHTKNERIHRDNLDKLVKLFYDLIK